MCRRGPAQCLLEQRHAARPRCTWQLAAALHQLGARFIPYYTMQAPFRVPPCARTRHKAHRGRHTWSKRGRVGRDGRDLVDSSRMANAGRRRSRRAKSRRCCSPTDSTRSQSSRSFSLPNRFTKYPWSSTHTHTHTHRGEQAKPHADGQGKPQTHTPSTAGGYEHGSGAVAVTACPLPCVRVPAANGAQQARAYIPGRQR